MSTKNSSILNNEINNFIVNESILNPINDGTNEYIAIIKKISKELAAGKKVITVIDGQLMEIENKENHITYRKLP